MFKRIIFASFIAVASFIPANAATWVRNLTVVDVYVGNYGLPQGRVYIFCSNSKGYFVDLGTDWGRGIMTAALTAQSTGRPISVWYTTADQNASEVPIDKLIAQAQ